MMRKSARFCAVLLALSLVLLAAALLLRGRLPGSWSGVLIGVLYIAYLVIMFTYFGA